VALIAARRQVIQVQSQIAAFFDRDHVIAMEMPFAAKLSAAQFVEHTIGRRIAQLMVAVQRHHIRFPAAIDAAPFVALETSDAQLPVEPVVPSIGTGAAIAFRLQRMTLTPAATMHQRTASGCNAWPGWL
jgi:hypothetical protein